MADYETRELSGSLFKNSNKRPDKQDADYQGRCKIGGVEFYINAWLNESKGGVKYMGLKFKEVVPREVVQPPLETREPLEDPNDSIPFN